MRWQASLTRPRTNRKFFSIRIFVAGQPGDKHSQRVVEKGLPGFEPRPMPVADDKGPCIAPMCYGFRSFDRQLIIPDNRLINQPNPELWEMHSDRQVYLTAPSDRSPTAGPALTFTALVPDLHHYHGRGGRVFPLWRDRTASVPNLAANLLALLTRRYGKPIVPEDVFAYIAAVAAHPAFTQSFQSDLATPGLRIPLAADAKTFAAAAEIGRTVVWLHTFGERFIDARHGRPAGPPRLASAQSPRIPKAGAISQAADAMPDDIDYDASQRRLLVGQGYIENVPQQVWDYEVSGKHVLRQWFSYRKANRQRPIIGDRRPTVALGRHPAGPLARGIHHRAA